VPGPGQPVYPTGHQQPETSYVPPGTAYAPPPGTAHAPPGTAYAPPGTAYAPPGTAPGTAYAAPDTPPGRRWWRRRSGRRGWAGPGPVPFLAVGLVALLLGCVLGAGVMAAFDRSGHGDRFGNGPGGPGHSWRDGGPGRPPGNGDGGPFGR
jgi:tetraspanin-3/YLP motif-containing protein 1